MEAVGLIMLAAVAALLGLTGLPVFVVLVGVSVLAAVFGLGAGIFTLPVLTALPNRLTGLLENDLLQALPLYVLMGALLDRLPLAETLFGGAAAMVRRWRAAPLLAALGVGALIAPMNGSVAASASTLGRVVAPRLKDAGVGPERSLAVICLASTMGVVVPPSLVLLLLGDAMMRAHTEALNATGQLTRILNTQDLFRGAVIPAALLLGLFLAAALWTGRTSERGTVPKMSGKGLLLAGATAAFIALLLGGVALGRFYAVEAAAMGAFALALGGALSGHLTLKVLNDVLADTMAVSGALFALFAGATTFTLVFRLFESDRLLARLVEALPWGTTGALGGVLVILALSALVLDAFEIIFVLVPVLMPPLLVRVPDTLWVAVAALLTLQASFLVPPLGQAVLMARRAVPQALGIGRLMRALAPFLALQMAVLALVLAFPALVHLTEPAAQMAPVSSGSADWSPVQLYSPEEQR
ncbi:TRAP dicarboxylate transporter DctM subunit unknown substrate 6 [Paramagnetospirillum magnetotacticum MS-1]|uniref:TRAP C4-dicarboxylate transport system permease DctM subunit domain-containing protein n=1 Tax=Paramagnetospirillum magnetotacticum MS-1 TaxID=272627 RepID=A0A0C2UW60_PARME|nr:TRAP transporter large permease subunit [Paramagnetospirillum magnetotacticum]KIL97046.1 TRAP dicarboxylate transporter DctM subunit unknown substrate 6 [Paramagnetospirillum magnetotacticum MS-1]